MARKTHFNDDGQTLCRKLVMSKAQLVNIWPDVTCRACQKIEEERERKARFRRMLHGDDSVDSE